MRALSFIGTGISSSELSLTVEYCCGCDWDLDSFDADAPAPWIGFDSLRLRPGRDVGRRSACLADVLRPREVKWLPGPMGVGDAVAIFRRSYVVIVRCFAVVLFPFRLSISFQYQFPEYVVVVPSSCLAPVASHQKPEADE